MIGDAAVVLQRLARSGLSPRDVIGMSPISSSSGVVKKSCWWGSGKSSSPRSPSRPERARRRVLQFDAAGEAGGPAPTTTTSGISRASPRLRRTRPPARRQRFGVLAAGLRPCRDGRRPCRRRPVRPRPPVCRRGLWPSDPSSRPRRSTTPASSVDASTTTALFHLLRSESASARICCTVHALDAGRRAPCAR